MIRDASYLRILSRFAPTSLEAFRADRTVASLAELKTIPSAECFEGMLVDCTAESRIYRFDIAAPAKTPGRIEAAIIESVRAAANWDDFAGCRRPSPAPSPDPAKP